MNITLPKCSGGGISVALKANYYKVGITCMVSTTHYPYGGILQIERV